AARMLLDEAAELGLEHVEDRTDLGGRHALLVVVEEYVIGVVVGRKALDVAEAEIQKAFEPRTKGGEVGSLASLHPDLVGAGARLDELGGELRRDAARFLPVAAGDAEDARVVRVVRERVPIRLELVEERPDPVVRE